MAEFGWAYLSNIISGQGPDGAVQYASGSDGMISGSGDFVYNTGSATLFLTGTMIISGTLQANTFDVIHTNKIELEHSGSTSFGNDSTDLHAFSGSVSMSGSTEIGTDSGHVHQITGSVRISGSFRHNYIRITGASYNSSSPYGIQRNTDHIIGVSSSNYVGVLLPTATSVGLGHTIVIKDEWAFGSGGRPSDKEIAVSASGGDSIEHGPTYSITGNGAALSLYSDGGTKWFIF